MSDIQGIEEIRKQFPILHQEVNGKPLVYFDNAASSQKPLAVINAISDYYLTTHSNVHRGVHHLSQKATDAYEAARQKIADHFGAGSIEEIIYTSGTTDAINLVMHTWGRQNLGKGDDIIVSHLEHHSNIVPWQMLCEETGATLKVIPVLDDGSLDMNAFDQLLTPNCKLVAVNHISNTMGTINPVDEIISKAHHVGARVLIDGAQAAPHMKLTLAQMDVDFYAISAHKMYGPTGFGVLYGKKELLNAMPPWRGGGEMIKSVSFAGTTYNELPHKFEAGTPHVAGAVGMGAAVDYINEVGIERIQQQEKILLDTATEALLNIEGLRIIGTTPDKTSVVSFVVDGCHPYDIGQLLDKMGIAVRTGQHCTEPLMDRFGIPGTVRASFAVYNTVAEINSMITALDRILAILKA